MKGNATGGILLLLLASFLIVVGASPRTKEIFALLFSGAPSGAPAQTVGGKYLEENLQKEKPPEQSGTPWKPAGENQIGFVGEKGARPA